MGGEIKITKSNKRSEYDQSAFYSCIKYYNEIPCIVLLVCDNKKVLFLKKENFQDTI
jgi:hypothetical protein